MRRLAILVDLGLGLVCLLIGLLFVAKAGDPSGLLAQESKTDAWRPLLAAGAAMGLAGAVRSNQRHVGLVGAIVWIALAIVMLLSFVASNKFGGKTALFVLALLACAGVHFEVWRDDRPR